MPDTLIALFTALGGFVTARALTPAHIDRAPQRLVRTNVNGRSVPAVLGWVIVEVSVVGCLAVTALTAAGALEIATWRAGLACLIVLLSLGAAGAYDDRRGDEADRGFAGHLRAAGGRRLTGGLVKVLAGGIGGLAAGVVGGGDLVMSIQVALCVALSANLINLLDRAPGRAGKVTLLLAIPIAIATPVWAAFAGAALGALIAVMPFDLGERGMLGDAGANPLGGLLGLGAAWSLGATGRWVVIAVLLALNLASERWSFSRIIANNPWLDRIDRLGRT